MNWGDPRGKKEKTRPKTKLYHLQGKNKGRPFRSALILAFLGKSRFGREILKKRQQRDGVKEEENKKLTWRMKSGVE